MTPIDFPSLYIHPRHADWLGRVLQLEEDMTRSDAQGVADVEFRCGALPKATDLPQRIKDILVLEIKFAIKDIKSKVSSLKHLDEQQLQQVAALETQIALVSA